MSRFGKCQNLSGCLLAYRGEETEVASDQPFVCAECGKPLVEVKSPAGVWMRYVYGLIAVLVLAGIAVFAFPQLRGLIIKHKEHHEPGDRSTTSEPSTSETSSTTSSTTEPSSGTGKSGSGSTSNPSTTTENPSTQPPVDSTRSAEPPTTVTPPPKVDLSIDKPESKSVKQEVLARIDQVPNITPADKDRLYMAVDRTRSMGKVLTIPFGSGRTDLAPADIDQIKAELEKPEIVAIRKEPTAVFVVLGYADPKGDAKKNLTISQIRAETVLKAMREKCGVINVIHSVGMGGSKLLDAQNLEKNRIVEIWAVIPP